MGAIARRGEDDASFKKQYSGGVITKGVGCLKGKLPLIGGHEIRYHKFEISHEQTCLHLLFEFTSFGMELHTQTNCECKYYFQSIYHKLFVLLELRNSKSSIV